MKRNMYVLIALFILTAGTAFAADPLLIYFENPSGGLRLMQPDGSAVSGADLVFGMSIPIGTTVVTENGDSVEIELPNGSIIKVQENTNFTITAIQGEKGATGSEFEMQVGKFRAVVVKVTGSEQYTFRTRTAVCGVRGTDTGAEALIDPATKKFLPSKVFVFSGSVEVTKLDDLGKALSKIVLQSGQWADTGLPDFTPLKMDPATLDNFKKGLDFKKLDPKKVPGHTATGPETEYQEPDWVKAFRDIIGLEIGAVMIGDVTYGKAVLSLKFKIDKLKLSLYLPVIYQTNLFDPSDWYHPDGNAEWSFGTDPDFGDNWGLRVEDFAYDLLLKIKSLEYGKQRDSFFLKLGTLNNFTIGHGMIMRNYANDSDFPAIRRIGFNIGADSGPFGFELMSNDLGMLFKTQPEIFGTRIYFRPGFPGKFAIGVSLLADLDPAKGVPNLGDPVFFNTGLDLDFPLVESEDFSLILFSDFAIMLPYFRSAVPGPVTIPAGFAFDAINYGPANDKSFRNFGVAAGLMGNVSLFEWRLEARYYTGKFKPAFYNAIYDRASLDYVNDVISYLQNPASDANKVTTLGIYGEGVLHIEKIFSLTIGYLCPVAFSPTGVSYGTDDYFQIKFALEPNVIPVVGIFGAISYERNNLISSLSGRLSELFDENTIVKATIGYPVTDGLDIIFYYTTTMQRDAATGTGRLVHTFTFETVIGF